MLNPTDLEIPNVQNLNKTLKGRYGLSLKHSGAIIVPINYKMTTTADILTFMSWIHSMLN